MYKVIIFDLGNTVFNIDFDKALEYWANVSGVSLDNIRDKYYYDEQQKIFETGAISEALFADHINKMLNLKLSFEDYEIGWNRIFLDYVENVEQVILQLKGKYTLAILSNTNSTHQKYWSKKYHSVLQHFDHSFLSNEMGLIKPDPKIYQAVSDKLNIPFEEMIFIDDKEENIKAAEHLGITGILIKTPQQAFMQLKGYIS